MNKANATKFNPQACIPGQTEGNQSGRIGERLPYGDPPTVDFSDVSPWRHWVEYWVKEPEGIFRGEIIQEANDLVENGYGMFGMDDNGSLYLEINVSDTFAPCCSHWESVEPWDIPTLALTASLFGSEGITVWFQQRNPTWKIAYKQIEEREDYKRALMELPPLLAKWDKELAEAGLVAPEVKSEKD